MRPLPDPRPFYKSLRPLLLWQSLPRPVDWRAIFGRSAPLEVEIGIGSGDYLARNAAEHPEVDFVGVELRWASVKRSLRNLSKVKAGNARLVIEDARPAVERLFGTRSLARVHVLFPCPWRKERHERHRLFHGDFLRLLNHRLVDGGELFCVTDWEPFVEWTLSQVPGTGFTARVEMIEARFGTKYERKWLGRGQQQFHEIHLTKTAHVDAPATQETTLNPHHVPALDLARFAPQDDPSEMPVTFKEIVRDAERGIVMVRTVVVEGDFTQHFWIVVARARDGSWWITPARGCQTLPTHGVQRALDRVRDAAVAN
jgi:tRNA (guanine-N7-)-methyltransferase